MNNNKADKTKCLYYRCRAHINDQDIQDLIEPAEFTRLQYLRRNLELSKNVNLRFCPARDCQGYDIGSKQKISLACNICSFEFCYYCNDRIHPGQKCPNYSDYLLDLWSIKQNARLCPGCQRRVEKEQGCDLMRCPVCDTKWCWYCGNLVDENHNFVCKRNKDLLRNPPFWFIICLFLSPLGIPLCGAIAGIGHTVQYLEQRGYSYNEHKIKYILLMALAAILGQILTPFLPFIFAISMARDDAQERSKNQYKVTTRFMSNLLTVRTLLLAPFGFVLVYIIFAVLSVFAHVVSYFLLPYKIGILLFCKEKMEKKVAYNHLW